MDKNIVFLKYSSVVVKVTAWIFLLLGIVGAIPLLLGKIPGNPRWAGLVILVFYSFAFFFLYLVAKIADILVRIISSEGATACGCDEVKKE
jgi:hypothetical protein